MGLGLLIMRIIAHRALLDGPSAELQNRPDQIQLALSRGYDVEIDLWRVHGKWMLGHDGPEHDITWSQLNDQRLWIHCKNMDAFLWLRALGSDLNYFWHENDLVTLTSKLIIWTYFGKPETKGATSVCVMPEVTYAWDDVVDMARANDWYGMCTDYPERLRACLV